MKTRIRLADDVNRILCPLRDAANLINGFYTYVERCFSRGYAARCAEAALPFREECAFILGYAPALRDREMRRNGSTSIIFRSAKPEGRSPIKKPQHPEGQSRFRTSGGIAAKNSFENIYRYQ